MGIYSHPVSHCEAGCCHFANPLSGVVARFPRFPPIGNPIGGVRAGAMPLEHERARFLPLVALRARAIGPWDRPFRPRSGRAGEKRTMCQSEGRKRPPSGWESNICALRAPRPGPPSIVEPPRRPSHPPAAPHSAWKRGAIRARSGEGPPHARFAAGLSSSWPRPKGARPPRSAHIIRSSPIRPRNRGSNWHIVDFHPKSGICFVSSHWPVRDSCETVGGAIGNLRTIMDLTVEDWVRANQLRAIGLATWAEPVESRYWIGLLKDSRNGEAVRVTGNRP